jgi:SPX domain protein involved in polyphosphate accumulation
MKFGKDLRTNTVPAWAKHYVNYKMLKQTIKKIGGEESAAAIKEFKQVLPKELTRVNAFYMAKVMHFETSLASDKLAFQMLKELGEMQTYVWINNQGEWRFVADCLNRTLPLLLSC